MPIFSLQWGLVLVINIWGGMKLAGSSLDMKIPMVMASISIPIFNFGEGRKKIRSARLAHEISTVELNKNRSLMDIEAQ